MGKDYEFLLPTSLSSIFQTCIESAWLSRRDIRPGTVGLDIPPPTVTGSLSTSEFELMNFHIWFRLNILFYFIF